LPRVPPSRRLTHGVIALICALAAGLVAGCGKKGPPLPPFAKAPAAPAEVSARRLGNRVEIRFTVPVMDLDRQRPAHIDRVEVWALTGQVLDPELFRKYATLVGTVPVRRPPPPPPDVKEGEPPPPPPPPSTEPGLDQGQPGIVIDDLTPDELVPVVVPELEKQKLRDAEARQRRLAGAGPLKLTPPDVGVPLPPPLTRYYVVVGRNGGRRGAMTTRMAVPLREAPPAPPQPTATAAENYVELSWTAPAGLRQPVSKGTAAPVVAPAAGRGAAREPGVAAPAEGPAQPVRPSEDEEEDADADEARPDEAAAPPVDPAQPAVAPPAAVEPQPAAAAPAGAQEAAGKPATTEPGVLNSRTLTGFPAFAIGYSVYEVASPSAPAPPLEPGAVPPLPRRVTPAPVKDTTWRDDKIELGAERCYQLRTVETSGTPLESEPSPVLCVSPTDTFPPKAPTSLAAVASEGAISLIWDSNTEADLAGYIVLRGRAGGATLQPLTQQPITETTFRDTTVRAGTRYVYAVVAVDKATPANVSAQSNRVEETAR
jgi:hypothetical protein